MFAHNAVHLRPVSYVDKPDGSRIRTPECRRDEGAVPIMCRDDSKLSVREQAVWHYAIRKRAKSDGLFGVQIGRRKVQIPLLKNQFYYTELGLAQMHEMDRKRIRRIIRDCLNDRRILQQKVVLDLVHGTCCVYPMAHPPAHQTMVIGFVLTICNAEEYQFIFKPDAEDGTPLGNATAHAPGHRVKRGKGGKGDSTYSSESPASSPKPEPNESQRCASADADAPDAQEASPKRKEPRGHRLPEDWVPSQELLRYAVGCGIPREKVRAVFEQFQNHWLAKPGAAGRKCDWDRTWKNWVSREGERYQKRARSYQPQPSQTEHWGLT